MVLSGFPKNVCLAVDFTSAAAAAANFLSTTEEWPPGHKIKTHYDLFFMIRCQLDTNILFQLSIHNFSCSTSNLSRHETVVPYRKYNTINGNNYAFGKRQNSQALETPSVRWQAVNVQHSSREGFNTRRVVSILWWNRMTLKASWKGMGACGPRLLEWSLARHETLAWA